MKTLDLNNYVMAGYPVIFIETQEIKRAVDEIKISRTKLTWNVSSGLENEPELKNPIDVLVKLTEYHKCVIIVENFNVFLTPDANIMLIQTFLNSLSKYKENANTLIIIGTHTKFHPIISKLIPVIYYDLPSKEDFTDKIKEICESVEVVMSEEALKVAHMCEGMSMEEAENTMARNFVETEGIFDSTLVRQDKRRMIKSTGYMDFMSPIPLEELGGLNNLKEYIFSRLRAWQEPESDLPKLKSLLLIGIPGTGKSLSAKVLSSITGWPIIFLDFPALKAGIVGESEKNIREATKIIDAFGNVIILLEEVEKSFNFNDNGGDSGVSRGLLSYFLTWMQESKGEKIIVGTANDISNVPPEFMRRWSTTFFVDFPNSEERKEIIKIMNKRYNSDLPLTEDFISSMEGWSGSELEQLAIDSRFDDLDIAISNIPLMKNTKIKEIEKYKQFSKGVRKANTDEIKSKKPIKKRIINSKETNEVKLDEEMKLKLKKIIKEQ